MPEHNPKNQSRLILFADDEPVIRHMLVDKLNHAGFEVLSARDGEEALVTIQTHLPAVVVLDWIMPKLDGLTLCRAIKANPALEHIKVIILTAHGQEANLRTIKAAGADLNLVKPVSLRKLVEHIRKLAAAAKPLPSSQILIDLMEGGAK